MADTFSIVSWLASVIFGAGSVAATTTIRLKRNEADLKEHKIEVGEKLDKIDTKIDNVTNHLIRLAAVGQRLEQHNQE